MVKMNMGFCSYALPLSTETKKKGGPVTKYFFLGYSKNTLFGTFDPPIKKNFERKKNLFISVLSTYLANKDIFKKFSHFKKNFVTQKIFMGGSKKKIFQKSVIFFFFVKNFLLQKCNPNFKKFWGLV